MPDDRGLTLIAGSEALASETRLVEVVDRLLDKGVILRGELWLTVADIDLVVVGADLLISTPDRMAAGRSPAGPEERRP